MTIRGTISGHSLCSEATLSALNDFFRNKARFLVDNENMLVVEYNDAATCVRWCNHMNLKVFPEQRGVLVGSGEDSAAQAVGALFRFPEDFWHLVNYIAEGRVSYSEQVNGWTVSEDLETRVGQWKQHEVRREPFTEWMGRKIASLASSA